MSEISKDSTSLKSLELSKILIDWAIAAGRYYQSSQTGYIHYSYSEEEARAQTIPIVENALFALALLRSRLVEQMQEAKGVLKGILGFQNWQEGPSYGSFPLYLHQYPNCLDDTVSLKLLAPFYWILKQFGNILGSDLKDLLSHASYSALEYALQRHLVTPYPYSLSVRLAAAQIAYGLLWNDPKREKKGRDVLDQLSSSQLEKCLCTKHLSDLLIGLQMVYPSLSDSTWRFLWQQMEKTWHIRTGCYIGPCIREWQQGEEPLANSYDLFAGYFASRFSRRSSLLSIHHLQACLIQPSPDRFICLEDEREYQGTLENKAWKAVSFANYAYTLLEKKGALDPSLDKAYTCFRLVFGDLHRLHSFVCQGGQIENVSYQVEEGGDIKLLFDLKDLPVKEESSPQREIEFFVDFHPDLQISLQGCSATVFQLGETIEFSSSETRFSLTFELMDGKGDFIGHLMRGNRPTQIDRKKECRTQAYDWILFLRSLRRQNSCRIQVTLRFQEETKKALS